VIRPTVATVSLDAIQANFRAVRDLLAREAQTSRANTPGLIAVVKASAYGHGATRVGRALESAGASMLACADIEEGVLLRESGITIPILVFGALSVSDLDGVFAHRLTPTVSTPVAARVLEAAAARAGVRLGCHLKIDTGMNRLGFRHDNLRRTMADVLSSAHLNIEAVYTHFATADVPESAFLDEQRTRSPHSARWDCAASAATPRTPPRCFGTRGPGTTGCVLVCCSTGSCRRRSPPPISTCDLPCHWSAVSWR
jgi:alanine racemase